MSDGATAEARAKEGSHTPLIQQYLDIKSRHPDAMVFFRVGDFYEMFFDDAHEASRLLGITLTARNNGASADVPMAGVPVKAVDEYLPELLRRGRRVAVAEQVEDADQADGLVDREVVEIITPGTTLEDTLLSEKQNNFVAALAGEDPVGIAMVDVSTGEFEVWASPADALADELGRLEPSEVVAPRDFPLPESRLRAETRREAWRFELEFAEENLRRTFDVKTVEGFGFQAEGDEPLIRAAGALVGYLDEVRPAGVDHLRPPRIERRGRYMHLDEMTRRNLELVEPLRSDRGTSLLAVLDRTRTAMGGRLLRRWLLHPLVEVEDIRRRQEAVAELVERGDLRTELRERLSRVQDLERLAGKLSTARAGPRGVLGLMRGRGTLGLVVVWYLGRLGREFTGGSRRPGRRR
jgi:DNA mismatch repair protein MutS